MNRFLAKMLGQTTKGKRTMKKPRQSCRLALEQLEAREVPVVGAFSVPTPIQPGTGFDGVVRIKFQGGFGTGTLLPTGRHILTAAHLITDDSGTIDKNSVTVVFDMPSLGPPDMLVRKENFRIHPNWDGNLFKGNDLAIIELPKLAPSGPQGIGAERYDIFRLPVFEPGAFTLPGLGNDIGQVFTLVGYGDTGTGATGATPGSHSGQKRLGQNIFDPETGGGGFLGYDFDNGTAGNGLGASEAMIAPGDSGGPSFLNGKIAGVHSSGSAATGFGAFGNDMRVSSFAGWIDAQIAGSHPLEFNMFFQGVDDDHAPDDIVVDVHNGNLEISVNGTLLVACSASTSRADSPAEPLPSGSVSRQVLDFARLKVSVAAWHLRKPMTFRVVLDSRGRP